MFKRLYLANDQMLSLPWVNYSHVMDSDPATLGLVSTIKIMVFAD